MLPSYLSLNMARKKLLPLRLSRAKQIAIMISIFIVLVLSLTDLASWIFNIGTLKSIIPKWERMKLSSSICFILAASNLIIIITNTPVIIRKIVPVFFSYIICCMSLISIYVDFYSLITGYESAITGVSFLGQFFSPAKRMAFMTSFSFLLSGCMLILLSSGKDKLYGAAVILIIPVFLISYFTIISYILDVNSFIELSHISVPLNTSIAFCGLGAAVLLLRSNIWFLRPVISGETAGIISRRLLLPLIILPIVIGWLRIQGERFGLFESEEGVVMVTITYTACFLILVWLTARSVYKIDKKRRASEAALREREIQLMELNATKDKFFNIVAHDLKNPFTSLLGSSELLYENIDKLEKENIRDLALILNDSAKSGYAILLNLLYWSRSQTGSLTIIPEKINLKNLIKENISALKLQASNKAIEISQKVPDGIFIFADKNILNTILRNLISNAIKFTYRTGRVIITATKETDEVIVSIKDTGIGIPKDKIKKLFKIDARNSNPGTENEQGTGLGLKLCKEFVEKTGGRIWVESEENKGSVFTFSIPIV